MQLLSQTQKEVDWWSGKIKIYIKGILALKVDTGSECSYCYVTLCTALLTPGFTLQAVAQPPVNWHIYASAKYWK